MSHSCYNYSLPQQSKLFLNLTKRQILCFGAAILVGLPLFFLLRKTGNTTLAAMTMILVMLPFFFLAMYEKNGQPLEVILRHFVTARFKRPQVRKYQTENAFCRKFRSGKTISNTNATIKKSPALLTADDRKTNKEAAHVKTSKKRITA